MTQDQKYCQFGHRFDLPPRWQWLLWPVLAFSGGGTALVTCFEEEATAMAEYLPVTVLPGPAALLYWFNRLVFKTTRPRQEDLSAKATRKEKLS